MHRFFVSPASIQGDEVILDEANAHQVRDVLRLRAGERIAALDNSGAEYEVELTVVERGRVAGRIMGRSQPEREPRTRLVLFQGLLKADKFEWVLQKGTELGIASFVPVNTERTVAASVGHGKRARWERILSEAAEQSGRTQLPELHEVVPFDEALREVAQQPGRILLPWEEERSVDLRAALEGEESANINLFIGPEGGFSASEVEHARGQGAQIVTLGPRILRAETAALAAAAAIFFALGDMG